MLAAIYTLDPQDGYILQFLTLQVSQFFEYQSLIT